jgi:hypothetical protein
MTHWTEQTTWTSVDKYIYQDDTTKLYHFVDEAEQLDDTGYPTVQECLRKLKEYAKAL